MLLSKSLFCVESNEAQSIGLEEAVPSTPIGTGMQVDIIESNSHHCREDGEVLALQEMMNEMGIGDR